MGLSGLDSALSGLRVAQQQLSVISTNVSNVNTPGYTRKILPQETLAIDGTAVGVRSNAITRNVDLNLERDFWTQVSTVNFYDVQKGYLNSIQEFHGPPDLEISVAAEIAELRDTFSALSDSPEDTFLQRNVVNQASTVANKINGFAELISQLRNDAQRELSVSVENINSKLEQIAELNKQIKFNKISGKTTAALEDARDMAIKELSEEIEVSFFTRADGVLVVQTSQGVQLADERAETVFFDSSPQGPGSFYPDPNNPTIGGIFVGGNPLENRQAIEITNTGLNGKVGALIELRDDILPRQQALIDEFAHKTALRFQEQGLLLFTNEAGLVPNDTAPDPLDPGGPIPVEYVGFANEIRVNQDIINDNTLIQQGTVNTDRPVQAGSNEVIQRIVDYVFSENAYQEAVGSQNLLTSGAATTLQEWLGVFSENRIESQSNLGSYTSLNSLLINGGDAFDPGNAAPPYFDQFDITFEETRTAPPLGPVTVTVSLEAADANFPIGGAINDALDQLIAEINAQILAAGVPPELAAVASRNGNGQLVIESRGNMDLASGAVNGLTEEGLAFLGLTEKTYVTEDPYIDVAVGNDEFTRVYIEPGQDENDLVNNLNLLGAADVDGVPGLAVEIDPLTGFITLRPGDDVTDPTFGGDLTIIGGSFEADGTGTIPGGIAAGTTIIEALFNNATPVATVAYSSTTSITGESVAFRDSELGPGANIDTGIISSDNLIDYAQKLVNRQVEEINAISVLQEDETAFRDLLEDRLLNESGVNLDQELSNLIIVQTAFAAAARVVSAIDEQFAELLRAV